MGTGNLVEGQQRYSFTSEYLDITMVEVLNQAGTKYEKIKPLDHTQLGDLSPEQYFGTTALDTPTKGGVTYYDKHGDSIYLYNAPAATSHTLASGLRVWFKRTISLYTMTDNTTMTSGHASREPGIPSPYHPLLCYMAALPYCIKYQKDRVSLYQAKVIEMRKNLIKFFGRREKDSRKIIKNKKILYY